MIKCVQTGRVELISLNVDSTIWHKNNAIIFQFKLSNRHNDSMTDCELTGFDFDSVFLAL